ncbi:MAG: HemK2/MTQ2 family protein methyltransferase [Halobacteriaceae archaeon]
MTDLGDRRGGTSPVYQPAEDSYLLAEAVTPHIDGDDHVLEVGSGSGVVAEAIDARSGAAVAAVDRNPHACVATAARGIPVVCGDLVTPFVDDAFDVVVFNPPYLPEHPDLDHDDWQAVAVTGGPEGRAVIDRFLRTVPRVITDGGTVFLLVSTLTGVDTVVETAAATGFSAVAIAEESFPFETLTVLKLIR